jgi:hypothetical protein
MQNHILADSLHSYVMFVAQSCAGDDDAILYRLRLAAGDRGQLPCLIFARSFILLLLLARPAQFWFFSLPHRHAHAPEERKRIKLLLAAQQLLLDVHGDSLQVQTADAGNCLFVI